LKREFACTLPFQFYPMYQRMQKYLWAKLSQVIQMN
jgi:DNA-binding ferritin-like protein (Dps family)